MLIPFFTFILVVQLIRTQQMDNITVIFNADNSWKANMNTEKESIFQVNKLYTKYCYVRISLLKSDPGLLIIADYQILPNTSFHENYKQGEKIDRISQIENRKTRFLKLKTGMGQIYIYVKANNTNNIYNISIIGSNEEYCDNDCNNNGICQAKGCICNKSIIGNDCNLIAEEVFVGTSKLLNISTEKQIKYFYIDISPLKNQKLKIDFNVSYPLNSIDDMSDLCLTFWSTPGKSLITKDHYDYEDQFPLYYYVYWQLIGIKQGFSEIFYEIPPNLAVFQNQFLTFAVTKDWDTDDNTILQMNFIQDGITDDDEMLYEDENDDSDKTNKLLSIIIPIVVVTLITLTVIVWYLKRRKRLVKGVAKQNQQQQNVQEPEKCGICLEDLNTAYKAIIKIQCGHQFHLVCIQDWGKKQQGEKQCPFCRRQFNPDQLQ
ncbi:unnamed protein product [Paramecium octaurelia]|uniref:RING-type domain-containing protein n=1 Tax=Paramecium octaurelia TaxID=43137 RepID=A0A8S1W9V4_PAROT|nr:unnamed protein product [Paramecium octaurelia]